MKGNRRKSLLTLFLLAALLVGCSKGSGAEAKTDKTSQNAPAPASDAAPLSEDETASSQIIFEGVDMDGNKVTSAVFANSKLTMVNVWATYCNPCLSEMPELGQLASEYDPETFQIIGIISDVLEGGKQESIDLAASLIEQTGADYPHLLLNESIFHGLLTDVSAVPTTFFIDENGVIVDTVIGAMKKSAWEEKINGLLEKQ